MNETAVPYNIPSEFVDVAKKDIERQKSPIDIRSKFENLLSSQSVQDIKESGVSKIGNVILTPTLLNDARNDEDLKTNLFLQFRNQQEKFTQKRDQPVVPLSSSDFTDIDTSMFDPEIKTTEAFQDLLSAVKDRQLIAKVFGKDSQLPLKGKQLIVDQFQTGSFYDEASRMIASLPGDVLRLPNLAYMINAGVQSAYHGLKTQEDGAMSSKFMQLMADTPNLQKYNAALNSSVVTRDAASRLQQWYKDTYTKTHGEDAYKKDHGIASIILDPTTGQPRFEVDAQGNIVNTTRDLDLSTAADLLDLSYRQLNGTEKSAMFFASIAPFTIPARFARSHGALQLDKKLEDYSKKHNVKNLTNVEILDQMRKQDGYKLWGNWRSIWSVLSLRGDKTRVKEFENINDHNRTILNYDQSIKTFEETIEDIDEKLNLLGQRKGQLTKKIDTDEIKSLKEEKAQAQKLLTLNKDARATYVRKNGGGRYDNPYLRSVIADDVIISSMMGYGGELFGSFDEDGDMANERMGEMILGLFAPIVSPSLTRGLAKFGYMGADFIAGKGGIKNMAMAMQNSKWLPFIKPGDLVNNDEVKFKKIIENINLREGKKITTPTEEQIQSFRLFSNIFQNMRQEYRDKAYASVLRYNDVMDGFEDEMKNVLKLTPEQIDENMNSLQLTMAEVTGLAPLISYSNRVGNNFNSTDAINDIDRLAAMAFAQEDKLNGVDTLLRTLKQSLRQQSGVDLDSNSQLQKTFQYYDNMIKLQRNDVLQKKQHLQKALDIFENNVGLESIDTGTINKIVDLKELLVTQFDALEMASRGDRVVATYNNLMTNAKKQLQETEAFAYDMDEKAVKFQIRRVADVMFDLEYGRKRATASTFYDTTNDFAQQNNIKVDFTKLIKNYINASEDLKGKPLQEIFGRGSDFLNTVGVPMKKTFTRMATNALRRNYSQEAIDGLKLTLGKKGIQVNNDLDLALYLADVQKEALDKGANIGPNNMLNFFQGSVEEAEDVYRYFRDKALYLNKSKNNVRRPLAIINEHKQIIDDIMLEAGGEDFLRLVKNQRSRYASIMGETTDMKGLDAGYAQEVLNSRKNKEGIIRKNRERIEKATQGNYFYAIDKNRPETPFYNIANSAEKFLREADPLEAKKILDVEVESQKNRIMHFLGATMVDGKFAFDLRDLRQRKILGMAEGILNTVVVKQLSAAIQKDSRRAKQVIEAAKKNSYSNLDQIQPESYNFVQSMNLIQLQNKLKIPVIKENGKPDTINFLDLNDVAGVTVDITELARTSRKVRDDFSAIIKDMKDEKGAVRIAANALIDDKKRVLSELEKASAGVSNPKKYFQDNFQNATPESIDTFIDDLVGKGMNRVDAETSVKYMYLKGIFEISGERKTFNQLAQFEKDPIRSEITDTQKFIDLALDPTKNKVAEKILGLDSKHNTFIQNIAKWINYAGGNPKGFQPRADTKEMTIDNVFSRTFNLARGMVSPLYVGTEVAVRMLLERNQSLLSVALKDKQAAKIMAEIIRNPEKIVDRDIKTLGDRVKIYVLEEAITNNNGKLPTLAEFIGEDERMNMGIESEKFTAEEVQ